MSQGSDSADLMVQEGIQVTESAVKLAGLGLKGLAVLVIQLLRDNQKLKGKTGLNNLLRSDKPLVTFTMDKGNLPEFKKLAEEYGVLFSSVHHGENNGKCDIMVRADHASVVHRIFEVLQQKAEPAKQNEAGHSSQNWLQQVTEKFTDPARRFEGRTGPLESLGAETLAALVYKLAAENREFMDASPLAHVFVEGKDLQTVEVPDFAKQDIIQQAEVLNIPLYFQTAENPGRVTMLAKAEDAPVVNRLFENMGLEPPMKEQKEPQGQQRGPAAKAEKAEGQARPAEAGRSSVKVDFKKAQDKLQAKPQSGRVSMQNILNAKAKPAAR